MLNSFDVKGFTVISATFAAVDYVHLITLPYCFFVLSLTFALERGTFPALRRSLFFYRFKALYVWREKKIGRI